MEESFASAVEVSEVAWVRDVFASSVSLIGISPKIYCSCHSCISNNFIFR